MNYQITVRHGGAHQRYHTFMVAAEDMKAALMAAAKGIPDDVTPHADLAEIRIAVDPDAREYVGE